MLEDFIQLVPSQYMQKSGLVFYSGHSSFSKPSPVYLIGANPGGVRGNGEDEHIGTHLKQVIENKNGMWTRYSSYLDGVWRQSAGQEAMQRRIAHMFQSLDLDLRDIPSSNLAFPRSTRTATIEGNMQDIADLCWPFHQAVISRLRPRIILCMGGVAGNYVRKRLKANTKTDSFCENNNRRWTSEVHRNASNLLVATVTHPSVADWMNPKTDPTPMIKSALR